MSTPSPVYRRVLLKVSGEGFCEPGEFGISAAPLDRVAREIVSVAELGCELAIVCGGGNFLRGSNFAKELGIHNATADYMGMLGTVINALAIQGCLEAQGVSTRVLSAIQINQVVEPFIRRRAQRHLEKRRVVILAAGTGTPFCSTDTAAALRARELGCDVILKGTKVGGVYTKDPKKHADAERLARINYLDVIKQHIEVMDHTAITMCRDSDIPIIVFNMMEEANILRVLGGDEDIGTVISR